MKKLFLSLLGAALLSGAALAAGPLQNGSYATVDQGWLYSLSGGRNQTFQSGVAAAGTTQATATQLSGGVKLIEIDTVPASSGVALPSALAGTMLVVYNATTTNIKFYPSVANNPNTGAQDTINGATSVTTSQGSAVASFVFMCAKDGVWAMK